MLICIIKKHRKRVLKAFDNLNNRNVDSIFLEIGADSAEDVSLDKVRPDRRELDRIIMGDILGLTDAEQLEVYRAVVDLVKSRIERAKSFGNRNKTKDGIRYDVLKQSIIHLVMEQ